MPLSDPDNDGTRPDVQTVFSLDNSRARVRDNTDANNVYEYHGKTINNANPRRGAFINYGTVRVTTGDCFQRPCWVFEVANDSWESVKDNLRYQAPAADVVWTSGAKSGSYIHVIDRSRGITKPAITIGV